MNLLCCIETKDIYEGKKTRNKYVFSPRTINRRSHRKTDYQKFLESVAPDLAVSK